MNPQEPVTEEAELPVEPIDRDRIMAAGLGFVSIVLAGAVGFLAFLSIPSLALISLAPFAGMIAALSCRRILDSVVVAALGTVCAVLLASVVSLAVWESPSAWLGSLMPLFTVAAATGALFSFVITRSDQMRSLITLATLAIVILNMWLLGTTGPSQQLVGKNLTTIQWLVTPVEITNTIPDTTLHLAYVQRMAQGQPYYEAVSQALIEKNSKGKYRIYVDTPLSYRPPTVFWLMSKIPNPANILLLVLFVGTLAVIATFMFVRLYVADPLALVAAMGVAALTGRIATSTSFMFMETWAGAFGLMMVAALLISKNRGETGFGPWQITALVAALIAALTRELGVAFAIVGLAASIYDPQWRSKKVWLGWIAVLLILGGAFAYHVSLVHAAVEQLPKAAVTDFTGKAGVWFDPTWRGIHAVVATLAEVILLKAAVLWPFVVLAVVGAFAGPRDWTSRLILAAVIIGGLVAVFFARPPVTNKDILAGYWGFTIMPTLMAATPLGLAWVKEWRSDSASNGSTEAEPSAA